MDLQSASITFTKFTELRISVSVAEDPELESCVRLSGKRDQETIVEVNGAPLCPGTRYELLPGTSHALICWSSSATVVVEASSTTLRNIFRTSSACAQPLAEFHCTINEFRGSKTPPRVLICGRNDARKTELGLTLVNYATRFGWAPVLVDLDPSARQSVSIPGAIGCCVVEAPTILDEDLVSHHLSVQYFVGDLQAESATGVSDVWLGFAKTLCDVSTKFKDDHIASSGSVVVAPEFSGQNSDTTIEQIVQFAGITHVLVLQDDWLFAQLVKVPGLVVDRLSSSASFMQPVSPSASMRLCQRRLLSFFEGCGQGRVNSFGHRFPLSSTTILRVVAVAGKVTASSVDRVDLENVINCVAAIVDSSQARRDLGGFLASAVCGFARIVSIDGQEVNLQTSLAKSALPAGKLTLIVGSVQLID
jgi:hypothetical protein